MPKPPVSRYRGFEVVLDHLFKLSFAVRRLPPFMRFVAVDTKDGKILSLDALDQFDDVAEPDERVIVAEKGEVNSVHFLYRGKDKHKTGWYLWAKYTSIPDPPPDAVIRDREAWREWCRQRWAKREKPTERTTAPGTGKPVE